MHLLVAGRRIPSLVLGVMMPTDLVRGLKAPGSSPATTGK